jgi:hypothetical protein
LYYILDNGIFKIDASKQSLDEFNVRNKTGISFELIKNAIIKWMKGGWYNELADISGISVDIVLELINIVFQLKFQAIISAVIRMSEIKNTDKQISPIILNWTKMFQYGLDSQLKLDLLELGLTDRTAILFVEKYCSSKGYNHQSRKDLRQYIKTITPSIYAMSPTPIPNIAFVNLIQFMDKL